MYGIMGDSGMGKPAQGLMYLHFYDAINKNLLKGIFYKLASHFHNKNCIDILVSIINKSIPFSIKKNCRHFNFDYNQIL